MPEDKEFAFTEPFDTWPPFLQKAVTHAVHTAATMEGAPKRCRLRDCRRAGKCMSRLASLEDISCHGGLSDAGEEAIIGMLVFLAEIGKELAPLPQCEGGRKNRARRVQSLAGRAT